MPHNAPAQPPLAKRPPTLLLGWAAVAAILAFSIGVVVAQIPPRPKYLIVMMLMQGGIVGLVSGWAARQVEQPINRLCTWVTAGLILTSLCTTTWFSHNHFVTNHWLLTRPEVLSNEPALGAPSRLTWSAFFERRVAEIGITDPLYAAGFWFGEIILGMGTGLLFLGRFARPASSMSEFRFDDGTVADPVRD